MLKTLMASLLIGAGIIGNTAVIAAPIDEITMEVIDVNSTETLDVLNEIKLPARYQGEDRIKNNSDMDESREEMKSSRDNMRDSRDEIKESKERINDTKDQIKGN